MEQASRGLAGLVGAFFFAMGIGFWFALDSQMAGFSLLADGPLGRAGIRADFGSFFISTGLLALWGAIRRAPGPARAAALLIGVALLGRIVSILLEGRAPGGIAPMVVELVSTAILLWAASVWGRARAPAAPEAPMV